ncbi:MAG: hypothetical protein ACI9VM_000734 [Candidatus Azotimanducaceae bacterium]|jgi:hypothetical protein
MSEQEKQESQKTVVAFIAGLLIGGLLVWVFGGTPEGAPVEEVVVDAVTSEQGDDETIVVEVDDSTPVVAVPTPVAELPVGNGAVSVADQDAGMSVSLGGATFPADEGWIGVREYVNEQLAGLLGVVRYSKEQGLVPELIVLQRGTESGDSYAVVFYSESGDRIFNLAEDVQVGGVMDTFLAQ